MKQLILTIFLFFPISLLGQSQTLKGEHFGIADGLSQNSILSITQDQHGFIWLGTQDGLNKFDAYQFSHYKEAVQDSTELNNDYILALHQSSDQRLWIGTLGGGLSCYDPKKDQFTSIPFGEQATGEVYAIVEDQANQLWIGTSQQGLYALDLTTNTLKHFPISNPIYALLVDETDQLWIGTDQGLLHFNTITNGSESIPFPSGNKERVSTIYQDHAGTIWVGSDQGLYVYDLKGKTLELFSEQLKEVDIRVVLEDSRKQLWVGTYGDGVFVRLFNENRFIQYQKGSKENTLPDNHIRALHEDVAGTLWFGTDNGVFAYHAKSEKFTAYRKGARNRTINSNTVRGFAEDKEGNLWISTQDRGLNCIKPNGEVEYFVHDPQNPKSISSDILRPIMIDREGKIWVGTTNMGISVLDPRTRKFTHYQHDPTDDMSLPNNEVWAIYQSRDDRIWIGTHGGGLALFQPATQNFIRYQHNPQDENSISINRILRILEDEKGNLWLGTSGKGLDYFDRTKNTFRHYESLPNVAGSLSNKYVLSLYQDNEGTLWVGTASGLNKFLPEQQGFKAYREADGFPNEMIYGVLGDASGYLWISTNNGIIKFNPDTEKIIAYTENDGLQSNEFNFGSYYQNDIGKLFFGGINGYNAFQPTQIRQNAFRSPVVITDFQLFNKPVPITKNGALQTNINQAKEITLNYQQSVIFFEFAALNYINADQNQYAYQLEGFDKDWNNIGNRRTTTYTNVPPGKYIFRVKGTNNDKVWNDEGVSLTLVITPPFWKELWFIALVSIVLLLTGIALYRAKINSIKSQQVELERLVAIRTAEISEKNEEITAQKNTIERAYQDVHLLNEIGYQFTSTLSIEVILGNTYHLVNQLLDASCLGIAIYNEEHKRLDFPVFIENNERIHGHFDLLEQNTLSAWCYTNQESIFINDITIGFREYLGKEPKAVAGELPLSVLYTPLILPDKKLGVMTVQSFKKDAYTDLHLRLLKSLALYIATSLENAKSFNYIQEQGETLRKANEEIQSSLRYAQRIQQAILPHPQIIHSIVENHFIFYQPRDIVGGDFYWFAEEKNLQFIAAVDCTGHGVPGGFMSMIGNQLLNEIVFRRHITEPDQILTALDNGIKNTLDQNRTASRDGMDISLCVIDRKNKKMRFAGANNPLFYIDNDTPHLVKGTRMAIGGTKQKRKQVTITSHEVPFSTTATYYLYSDGYQDQFGGKENMKFMSKQFRRLLLEHHQEPLAAQKELLAQELHEWQGKGKQIDDILVIGFRL